MKLTTFACEVCRRPKGEANHWYLGRRYRSEASKTPFGDAQRADAARQSAGSRVAQREITLSTDAVSVRPWNEDLAFYEHFDHLCGLECVTKWVQQHLGREKTHA